MRKASDDIAEHAWASFPRERYAIATTLAGSSYGDLSSTRHQARLLLEHKGVRIAWLDDQLHIVLPFSAEKFRAVSVDFRPDGHWGERFEHLLECAN